MSDDDSAPDGQTALRQVLEDLERQDAHPGLVKMCWGGMTLCQGADELGDPLMDEMCSTIVRVLARCVAETHERRKSGGRWVLMQ